MQCNVKVEISPPTKTKTDLDGILKMSIRMNYLKRNKLHYNILSSNCVKGSLEATVVGRPVLKYLIMAKKFNNDRTEMVHDSSKPIKYIYLKK